MDDDIKQIALILYPEDFIEIDSVKGFKIDNNAGRRTCAETVAGHFLKVLRDDQTVEHIMSAFYRREHREEPKSKDLVRLKAIMGTALLAYEQQLKKGKLNE